MLGWKYRCSWPASARGGCTVKLLKFQHARQLCWVVFLCRDISVYLSIHLLMDSWDHNIGTKWFDCYKWSCCEHSCTNLGVHMLFPFLGWIPRSEWLDHLIDIFLTFQELPNCFSRVDILFYTYTRSFWEFLLFHVHANKITSLPLFKTEKTPKYVLPETFPELLCPVLKTEIIPTTSSSFVRRYFYILCSDSFTYLCSIALSASWRQGASIPFS